MGRPNPARKLALLAYCPDCHKERRVIRVTPDAATVRW